MGKIAADIRQLITEDPEDKVLDLWRLMPFVAFAVLNICTIYLLVAKGEFHALEYCGGVGALAALSGAGKAMQAKGEEGQ